MHGSIASDPWPRPLELGLRLVAGYGLVLWSAQEFGRELVALLLPAFAEIFTRLDDHYRILALAIGTEGADTVVRLKINLIRPIAIGGVVIPPHPLAVAEVTTAVGTVLQTAVVALGLTLAWPARRIAEWPLRLGMAALGLLMALLWDTPFVLWAYLWDIHVHVYEPARFSPLLLWEHFLMTGGRFAIGIAIAVLAIAAGRSVIAGRLCRQGRGASG